VMIFSGAFAALAFALSDNGGNGGWRTGQVSVDLALVIFAAAAISSSLGIHLNAVISPKLRRYILGFLLLSVCARMTYKALG